MLFSLPKKHKSTPVKGAFARHLWVYGLNSSVSHIEKHLLKAGGAIQKDAMLLMLKGDLERRARFAQLSYRYAFVSSIDKLSYPPEKTRRQRLIWAVPSLGEFKFYSQEDAERAILRSPRQAQLYRAMSPIFDLARHNDDYSLIVWYLTVREALDKLRNQPFPVVPVSQSHPRLARIINLANQASSLPAGCSIMDNLDKYNLHSALRYLFTDLFHTLKQLSQEPMTHARIRMAAQHTQSKAGKAVMEVINAKARTSQRKRMAAKSSGFQAFPQMESYA